MPTDRPRGTSPAPGPPGMMPPGLAPRASGSAARLARPPFNHPLRPPERPTPPPAPTGTPCPLPHPPSDRPWRVVAWPAGRRRVLLRGSCCEGHPARAPTVRSPAAPALTQRNATTVTDPQSPNPGPLGPGRFYTDSPTPFGV
ncbi:hypothetical protein AAEP93_009830 [Penicillium crustosum]